MENMVYGQYFATWVGVINGMIQLLAVTLSILTLILLYVHKDKINKIIFSIFHILLWMVLLWSLSYAVTGFLGGWLRK